jgi:acetylglutamate kinase
MNMPLMVIKTGGRAAEDDKALSLLAHEIKGLLSQYKFLIVHGGGAAVSSIQKRYGIEPVFQEGIRMTTEQEMDLVDMGLAGLMNKKVVRLLAGCGLKAVGLSGADGSLATGESIGTNSRTGKVIDTDTSLVNLLLENGFTPVIAPVSSDKSGSSLNINADEVALALGTACQAESIVFLSDIPGILREKDVINELNQQEAAELIQQKIINGGMIPKVQASLKALEEGAGTVVIGEYKNSGDLKELLDGKKGTKIWLK